jgi:hypothetical protein
MQRTTRICLFAAGSALSLLANSCASTKRVVVSIDSHPTAPVMDIQSHYWERNRFTGRTTLLAHEFWSCREQGSQVVCQRLCGANLEYACPGAAGDIVGE